MPPEVAADKLAKEYFYVHVGSFFVELVHKGNENFAITRILLDKYKGNDKKITWDVLSLPSKTNERRDAEFLEFFFL
jgi:hypothetical protein